MMNNSDRHNNNEWTDHYSNNEYDSTPGTTVIINCVLNLPLMLISILGNALVLAAIIRTPSIRSTSMIMLCSLAVSDLLIGFLVQPFYVAEQLTRKLLLNNLVTMMAYSLCGVSFLTITAITVDRFLALHFHMRYATLVTKSRVKYALAIIWLISFLGSGFQLWNMRLANLLTAVVASICLTISTFSYIRIYVIVRRHQFQIHVQQQAVQSSISENNLNMVRLKRSAKNTFVFYTAFIICYFPMNVILALYGISVIHWQREFNFAYTAVYMNSSINPFLYCWRLRHLRTAVVKTARQMLCKQTDEN